MNALLRVLYEFLRIETNEKMHLARFHARIVGGDLLQTGIDQSKHEVLQLADNLVVASGLQLLDL